jgi:protein-disulfide isomerase
MRRRREVPVKLSLFAVKKHYRIVRNMIEGNRSRLWAVTALVLAGVVVGYVLITRFGDFRPSAPQRPQVSGRPDDREVVHPKIRTLEEIAQYTAGRPIPEPTTERAVGDTEDDDHILGNPDATITIIEYTNLDNLYARLMHQKLKELVEEDQNVNLMFRHFPFPSHPFDVEAAEMSECVYLQLGHDGFWEYIDRTFKDGLFDKSDIIRHAMEVGADEKTMEKCMEKDDAYNSVRVESRDALIYSGVSTTPSFFFRDNRTEEIRYMQGADTMSFIRSVVDEMLK